MGRGPGFCQLALQGHDSSVAVEGEVGNGQFFPLVHAGMQAWRVSAGTLGV